MFCDRFVENRWIFCLKFGLCIKVYDILYSKRIEDKVF